MPFDTHQLGFPSLSLSLAVLVIALAVFPQLNILQNLLLFPAFTSLGLVVIVVLIVRASIRRDLVDPEDSVDTLNPVASAELGDDAASEEAGSLGSLGSRRHRALRSLAFTTPSAWSAVLTRSKWEDDPSPGSIPRVFRAAPPHLAARIDAIFGLVKGSFIIPWYSRISPSSAFPNAVEVLVRQTVANVISQGGEVDWSALVVSKVVPILKTHLQHFRSVEHLSSSSLTPSPNPALPLPLPARAHPALSAQSHLGAGSSSPAIEAHLRGLLERALESALPESDRSEVVKTMVREVILGTVMMPMFDMLCDSDFWNRQIDEKGGQYLHEQKQVNKFLSALSNLPRPADSPVTPSRTKPTAHRTRSLPPASSISASSSTQQFDAFIRSVSKLKTLGEARRLRADVERELRAAKLAGADEKVKAETGKDAERRLRRAKKYEGRLEKARSHIDARIGLLSGQHSTIKPEVAVAPSLTVREVNLYTVLSDPSSLAYWLEHMERRSRSRLVQFWLTVEGLKDPLEAAAPDLALDSSINSLDDDSLVKDNPTLAEDVSFLYDAYFSDSKSNPIDIPQKHLTTIRLLATSPPDPLGGGDVRRAKQAMFASQKAVYEQMREEDWGDFRKGELYLKAVTDLERSGVLPPLPAVPSPSPAAPAMPPPAAPSMPPPPIHPQRQVSAPIMSAKRQPEMRSPSLRQGPTLHNGSITPSSATTPVASVSTTPPTFDLPAPEIRPRVASADERMSSSLSSLPSPPHAVPRRSSHLDFLIGSEAQEEDKERAKLFGDEDDEGEDDEDYVQVQRMEAIQAALNEIIASDDALGPRKESVATTRMSPEPEDLKSPSASMILMGAAERPDPTLSKAASRSAEDLRSPQLPRLDTTSRALSPAERKASDPPALPQRRSTSNLHGLQGGGARGKLFDDEVAEEDEVGDEDMEGDPIEVVQLAAPGDLQLSVEIARLQDKILDLVKQEHLLDSLIRQAELTGNQTELRILRRSQSSVRREQRTAIFQKAQFEQQEEENRLVPGRTKVDIPSAVVTTEEGEGKQVVRYTIEVKQIGEDGSVRVAWVVARRYNEFWELDRAIKEWAITSGDHALLEEVRWKIAELPGKKLVPNVSSSFIESRKLGLEKYLQSLVASARLCDTSLLRNFLSRSPVPLGSSSATTTAVTSLAPHNIVKSLYKTMATSLDDALLGPSMLDLMYTTLSRQLTDVAEGFGGIVGLSSDDVAGMLPSALKTGGPSWIRGDGASAASGSSAGPDEKQVAGNMPISAMPIGGESGSTAFTAPICDLFIELFDLKENNWLRRQAIVVILQQFLGSTLERKVRDSLRNVVAPDSIERALSGFQESLWPGGVRRLPSTPRTAEEMSETKLRASKKLALLIPDVAANMIGRGNARRAARRVFGALQDRRLNQQLILCIIDEVFQTLFPVQK
ncbi:hypothetical protein JCM24511_01353 [Saitozyma sp. JCM 24511]|nr:hypothetical protein JCM24511_01353 [Saitozyma sp. JCM 24511]